jgi:hypothetical protein
MREATLEIEAELGRSLPDDFSTQVMPRNCSGHLRRELKPRPISHETLAAIALPVCVASSGTPEKISASASIAPDFTTDFAPHIFSAVQVKQRQAGAGPVSVRRRADGHVAQTMPGDRGQRPRRHRRALPPG